MNFFDIYVWTISSPYNRATTYSKIRTKVQWLREPLSKKYCDNETNAPIASANKKQADYQIPIVHCALSVSAPERIANREYILRPQGDLPVQVDDLTVCAHSEPTSARMYIAQKTAIGVVACNTRVSKKDP